LLGQGDGVLGADDRVVNFLKAPLGKVPVMTELAAVITAGRAGTKNSRPWQHVKGRFFFDGVNLQGAGPTINVGVIATFDVDLVAAKTTPAFGDDAAAEAHLALYLLSLQLEVVARFVESFGNQGVVGGGRNSRR
jgi:hypothetical protein